MGTDRILKRGVQRLVEHEIRQGFRILMVHMYWVVLESVDNNFTTSYFYNLNLTITYGNTGGDSICQGLKDTIDDEKYSMLLTGRRIKL